MVRRPTRGLFSSAGCVSSVYLSNSYPPSMSSTSLPCSSSLPAGSRLLFLFDTGLLALW